MRKLFWILLLGNVVLYAVMKSNGFGMGEPETQAQPDLHGDMIRLIPVPRNTQTRVQPPSRAATVSAPLPAHAPAPAPAAVPVEPVAPPVAAHVVVPAAAPEKVASIPDHPATTASTAGTTACLEWGDFSGPDLARATAALSAMQLADKLSQRQVEHDRGYWVYFPPLRNRAAVNRKIKEIKALGITDYYVVQSGRWQNAISLGVFKTREAAQNYLNYMHTKGVHTAKVGERASKLKATIFMLDGLDAATVVKLTTLQKDFPGSELNVVPCALTK